MRSHATDQKGLAQRANLEPQAAWPWAKPLVAPELRVSKRPNPRVGSIPCPGAELNHRVTRNSKARRYVEMKLMTTAVGLKVAFAMALTNVFVPVPPSRRPVTNVPAAPKVTLSSPALRT